MATSTSKRRKNTATTWAILDLLLDAEVKQPPDGNEEPVCSSKGRPFDDKLQTDVNMTSMGLCVCFLKHAASLWAQSVDLIQKPTPERNNNIVLKSNCWLAQHFPLQRHISGPRSCLVTPDTKQPRNRPNVFKDKLLLQYAPWKRLNDWIERDSSLKPSLFSGSEQNNQSHSSGCSDCHFPNQGLPCFTLRSTLLWNISHSRSISSSQCSASLWKPCPWNTCIEKRAGRVRYRGCL